VAGSVIGIEPADPHRTGMGRAHGSTAPVSGGGRCAAIRRDVADRQRLAAVFGGIDCLVENGHGGGAPGGLTGCAWVRRASSAIAAK
jgi:hypothetical protein